MSGEKANGQDLKQLPACPAQINERIEPETASGVGIPQCVQVLAEDGRPYFPDECFE